MRTLSIDPAGSSGFVLFNDEKVARYGLFKTTSGKPLPYRLREVFEFFRKVMVDEKVEAVFLEGFMVGGKSKKSAAESSYSIRAVIQLACELEGIPLHMVNVSLWHSHICGLTRASREQKRTLGKDAIKIITQEKLKALGYSWPDSVKNERTGKVVKMPYDVTDALGIGVYGIECLIDKDN